MIALGSTNTVFGENMIHGANNDWVAREVGEAAKAERVVFFGSLALQALREGEPVHER